MLIACQEGLVPGSSFEEKLDRLAEAGYDGVEIRGDGLADRVETIRAAAKNHTVKLRLYAAGFATAALTLTGPSVTRQSPTLRGCCRSQATWASPELSLRRSSARRACRISLRFRTPYHSRRTC